MPCMPPLIEFQLSRFRQVSPMAGMLPGVECARRRRLHQTKACSDSPPIAATRTLTRKSILCLYTSNHETLLASNPSLQGSLLVEAQENDNLDGIAREAKRRLDERLRKSEDKRGMATRKFSWTNWIAGEKNNCGQCW
ncbi:uncharacterized protein LOC111498516 isoform X2 [Cucurbita maxima]|uniref:Uncharacterized protein LOC111498516 isoform X2 n=1 Tax=Cucurbita maxima TaxID=3661 RepID=A0A6J1KZN5_CUCMA|nr:uncharacterized protein LOC111498516 isoform X2 [Cucurbita maxima]